MRKDTSGAFWALVSENYGMPHGCVGQLPSIHDRLT